MSTRDLSILSYRELQALAVKHRVPGNVKKFLLLQLLHAVETGNESEVTKLVSDLKKDRKEKKKEKIKTMKSTDHDDRSLKTIGFNDSLDYVTQQENYLFPMQQCQEQHPFEWVGAEEEVGSSKYDDLKYNISYNDIRQFVYYTAQSVYEDCDTNNNSTLLDEIIDLRTEATVSNYRSSIDTSFMNTVSHQQQIACQSTIYNNNSSKKMSVLLKKMLQAPVGANLEAIASPVSTGPIDTYPGTEEDPDNSDTMTAKSDINENDELWQDNITPEGVPYVFQNEQDYKENPYYHQSSNVNSYYRSMFDHAADQNNMNCSQQQLNQYQFNYPQADAQEVCRNWLASTTLNIANPVDYGSHAGQRHTPTTPLQYQSSASNDMMNSNSGGMNSVDNQNNFYGLNNSQLYMNQSTPTTYEPSEIVSDVNYDATRYYNTSPNDNAVKPLDSQDNYRQPFPPNYNTNFYESHQYYLQQQQQLQQQLPPPPPYNSRYSDYSQQQQQQQQQETPASPIYHVELKSSAYDPEYYQEPPQPQLEQQQQQNAMSNQPAVLDSPQQVQQQQHYENYPANTQPSAAQNNSPPELPPPPTYASSVTDQYWPRWTYNDQSVANAKAASGRSLENTLNLCTPNYVDYSKLNETCCVYSNKTPVMTLRKGLNSVPSIQDTKAAAAGMHITAAAAGISNACEDRQHNFASNWLLYNNDDGGEIGENANVDGRTSSCCFDGATSSSSPASLEELCPIEQQQQEQEEPETII